MEVWNINNLEIDQSSQAVSDKQKPFTYTRSWQQRLFTYVLSPQTLIVVPSVGDTLKCSLQWSASRVRDSKSFATTVQSLLLCKHALSTLAKKSKMFERVFAAWTSESYNLCHFQWLYPLTHYSTFMIFPVLLPQKICCEGNASMYSDLNRWVRNRIGLMCLCFNVPLTLVINFR